MDQASFIEQIGGEERDGESTNLDLPGVVSLHGDHANSERIDSSNLTRDSIRPSKGRNKRGKIDKIHVLTCIISVTHLYVYMRDTPRQLGPNPDERETLKGNRPLSELDSTLTPRSKFPGDKKVSAAHFIPYLDKKVSDKTGEAGAVGKPSSIRHMGALSPNKCEGALQSLGAGTTFLSIVHPFDWKRHFSSIERFPI